MPSHMAMESGSLNDMGDMPPPSDWGSDMPPPSGRTRTHNVLLRRQMLYLLSYKRYSGTNHYLLQINYDSYKCYVLEVDVVTNRKYPLMQCYHVP